MTEKVGERGMRKKNRKHVDLFVEKHTSSILKHLDRKTVNTLDFASRVAKLEKSVT